MEDFICGCNQIYGKKYDYSLVTELGRDKNITVICPEHGSFVVNRRSHYRGYSACKICSESYGEGKIRIFLENNNINHNSQQTFETCKYKRLLSFDFFLPVHNILIEYQGAQHYFPIKDFGGQEAFEDRLKRDLIKRFWAMESPYTLHYIDYDENVNNSLNRILKTG